MAMETDELRLRKFLARYFPPDVMDSDNFFTSGLVSSLFALQLVMFVEKEFLIEVGNDDLELSNFNSLPSLLGFVRRKRLL
jgi:methoxymalonate biosynthesis acyl carrier protein